MDSLARTVASTMARAKSSAGSRDATRRVGTKAFRVLTRESAAGGVASGRVSSGTILASAAVASSSCRVSSCTILVRVNTRVELVRNLAVMGPGGITVAGGTQSAASGVSSGGVSSQAAASRVSSSRVTGQAAARGVAGGTILASAAIPSSSCRVASCAILVRVNTRVKLVGKLAVMRTRGIAVAGCAVSSGRASQPASVRVGAGKAGAMGVGIRQTRAVSTGASEAACGAVCGG